MRNNTATRVLLAGNPNVGKSTVFNALTGMNQHTGNWAGKTVVSASGEYIHANRHVAVVDLPGTYSLEAESPDERAATDMLEASADLVVIVVDALALGRNLLLALQIRQLGCRALLCVNFMNVAKAKGVSIDLELLSKETGIPAIGISARDKRSTPYIKDEIERAIYMDMPNCTTVGASTSVLIARANEIAEAVTHKGNTPTTRLDRRIDSFVTGKKTGLFVTILLLLVILWLTIAAANKPSEMLGELFGGWEGWLRANIAPLLPMWLVGALIDGMYKTLAWVVAVMLPPMAIFFPMFTILEDSGVLPRIAFNLDNYFKKAGAHGKMSLCMCMGLGCNAVGVSSCNIIDSERERLLAVVTNNFIPCNGRFPAVILLCGILANALFGSTNAFITSMFVLAVLIFSVMITLLVTRILSATAFKGMNSHFYLELPPYRTPDFKAILVRSLFDRTLKVLLRAIVVAAPAGVVIWVLQNTAIDGINILGHMSNFLEPAGLLLGLNGVILTAFILGLPANEIVIPLILMMTVGNTALTEFDARTVAGVLSGNGFGLLTVLCMLIFFLNHYPCATTLLTIRRETGSIKQTALAFIIPTIVGCILCFTVNLFGKLF